MTAKRVATTLLTILLVLAGYLCTGFETYCVLNPSIDTRYAPGFTEANFAKVTPGMTKAQVAKLLGYPFGAPDSLSSSRWSYTQDGKSKWGDWAWLGREVYFDDLRVTKTNSVIYYD